MNALASLAGSLLTASAQSAYNMQEQNKYNTASMKASYDYGQMAQRNSALNQVQGLKMAGLSPALAGSSAFSPAQTPQPAQVHPTGDNFSPLQLIGMFAGLGKQRAETDLLTSQAVKNDIESKRMASEDSTINAQLREYFSNRAKNDPENASMWQGLADAKNDFDKGVLDAMSNFDNYLLSLDNADLKFRINDFERKITRYQSDDEHGIWRMIAEAPIRDKDKFYSDLSKTSAEIGKLLSSTALDQRTMDEKLANIRKMYVELDKTYHTDFAGMINNKDYFLASLGFFKDLAQSFSIGAGAASAAALFRSPAAGVKGFGSAHDTAKKVK